MTKEDIKNIFIRKCVTAHKAIDPETGEPMPYRRKDLAAMAQKAHARGENYFYCKPADSKFPFKELVECGPEYEYVLFRPLKPEEFNLLFQEDPE